METLSLATRAFEAGDFKRARQLALQLPASDRAQVAQILAATASDRIQLAVLLCCLALFMGVAYHYLP